MSNRGINLVLITGNMGDEPDYRAFQDGSGVTTISVATSHAWKDKTTNEQKEKTSWHKISLFGHCANYARDYAQKGSLIFIRGEIEYRKWQDQSGQDRYSTDITVNPMNGGEFQILTNGKGKTEQSSQPKEQPKQNEPPVDFDDVPF